MSTEITPSNFIEDYIVEDLESGRYPYVYTRFPPEPNGYLHIGHCKSLCINFGIKEKLIAVHQFRHKGKISRPMQFAL